MNSQSPPLTTRPAFTLIEMMVALAVIAILLALLLPVIGRSVESGRSTRCLSNLRQAGVAIQLYVDDHNDRLPIIFDALVNTNLTVSTNPASTINVVLTNYLGDPRILQCPSDQKSLFQLTGSSYSWNSLLNGQRASELKVFMVRFDPHQIPVLFDKETFHKQKGEGRGINFLYADGHIKNLLAIEGTR